jgi:hypothetical protein
MHIRKALIAALAAGGVLLGASGASVARTYVDITVAPPAPQYEEVPAPRVGYVWAPGAWYWEGHHHVWHGGHWVHERHGYAYVGPRWHQEGDRWRFDDGHWERNG